MLKEFREFALKGNLIDFAVGVIVGGAFGAVSNSFVADLVSPLLGLLTGGTDFKSKNIVLKAAEGDVPAVTLNWGNFLYLVINFLIVAFVMFLVVKAINSLRKKEADVPAAPPAPTNEEKLLMEIRNSLKAGR
jgi:large conductance mechanosensitive channel